MKTNFYKCPICGNVVVNFVDSGVIPHCCGQEMIELQAKNVDSLVDKHVPVLEYLDDNTVIVRVGATPHPMTTEHHIRFIWLETAHGGQLRHLVCDDCASSCAPACDSSCATTSESHSEIKTIARAKFHIGRDPVTAVYEYCNLHGLWKYTPKH